jgi:CheY-like chemotaxis protein
VIEDDAATRELLTRLVAGAGYRAATATNGREGLDWLDAHTPPDLILLDLMMPNLDGFGFLGELRRRRAYDHLPVVIVTAKDLSEDDLQRLRELHAEIITKDGDYLDELVTIMRQSLKSDAGDVVRTH